MIEDLGGVTSQLVKLALDVSSMRQQVIANNIANASTPGYAPQQVNFEQYLKEAALLTSDKPDDDLLSNEIKALKNDLKNGELIVNSKEKEVAIDMEMIKLSDNVLRYKALLEGLSKRGSLIKMALNNGG
jgi:flagellar basal-body rod protein FlgB